MTHVTGLYFEELKVNKRMRQRIACDILKMKITDFNKISSLVDEHLKRYGMSLEENHCDIVDLIRAMQ